MLVSAISLIIYFTKPSKAVFCSELPARTRYPMFFQQISKSATQFLPSSVTADFQKTLIQASGCRCFDLKRKFNEELEKLEKDELEFFSPKQKVMIGKAKNLQKTKSTDTFESSTFEFNRMVRLSFTERYNTLLSRYTSLTAEYLKQLIVLEYSLQANPMSRNSRISRILVNNIRFCQVQNTKRN